LGSVSAYRSFFDHQSSWVCIILADRCSTGGELRIHSDCVDSTSIARKTSQCQADATLARELAEEEKEAAREAAAQQQADARAAVALEAALERDELLAAHRQQMKASKLAKRLARAEADNAAFEAAEAEKTAAAADLTAGSGGRHGGGEGGGGTSTSRNAASPARAHSALESVDGDDPGMGAAWTTTDCVMDMRKQFYRLLASQSTPLVC
jgi:hypothetical protein